MTAAGEIASDALRTATPSAVTRPAAIAAWARARLANRPRATNRRSARSRVFMCLPLVPAQAGTQKLDSRLRGNERNIDQTGPGGRSGPNELDRLAAHVLAERFERLGDDAFGIEAGFGVHGVGRVLVDEEIGQHHGADFDAAVERAMFGERLQRKGAETADGTFLDGEQH